jgi:hypothetical protein
MLTVNEIRTNHIRITNEPIVYSWWFKATCLERLLIKLNDHIDFDKVKTREIDGEKYVLLYIGKGKKGHDRLVKYHIYDSNNFHTTGVQNGRLSSLRATLCGLLGLPMSISQKEINSFIDENCLVEWDICEIANLDRLELKEITSNYLPLNWQHTTGILTKEHRKILSKLKKEMRT